jgi:glycosyltransferase involved in cell wall biosynthesis
VTTADPTPIRLLSLVADGIFSPVLDSQIVVPLGLLGEHAPHVRRALLVLTSFRHRNHPQRVAREETIRAALPGVHVTFGHRPNVGMPLEWHWWNHMVRRTLTACGYSGDDPIVLHCRGELTAAAVAQLKRRDRRLRILVDVRGAGADEVRSLGWLARYFRRRVQKAQRLAFESADALNAVSHRLVDHLRATGVLKRPLPHSVVGCCADTQRFYFDPARRAQQRKDLGFGDRFVVCYCGSMAAYQRPDVVAEAFAGLLRGMPDAHLFVVSHEGRVLVDHLAARRVDTRNVTARAAKHDQVAPFLMAADVGLLLREDSLTNRVASPVKFAEYVRCGLPVILTPYIGDCSDIAVEERLGATVGFPPTPEEVLAAAQTLRAQLAGGGDAERARCSAVAGERFAWDAQLRELLRLYELLSQDGGPAPDAR